MEMQPTDVTTCHATGLPGTLATQAILFPSADQCGAATCGGGSIGSRRSLPSRQLQRNPWESLPMQPTVGTKIDRN